VLTDERRQFVKQRLKEVKLNAKGEDPPAPFQFEPRSVPEARMIREYAFLWLATEPEQLPSHRFGTLSMWYWGEDTVEIHDVERDKQYRQLAASLERIVTAYEKPKPSSDGD
jgi:hypothetical protein